MSTTGTTTITTTTRTLDGSAGDADYSKIGLLYAKYRQPEARIAALIHNELVSAKTVLNIGAGAGSYEPTDKIVTAVEPSATMRAQRPPHLTQAIDAVAEHLPFPDGSFDAAMATFTIHQWRDLSAGLREVKRVTKGPIVIMTYDPSLVTQMWLNDYAPGVMAAEARRYPTFEQIKQSLGVEHVEIIQIPVPLDCTDGFVDAYYGHPEKYLEAGVRLSCSAWTFVSAEEQQRNVDKLAAELASGEWDKKYGHYRTQPFFLGPLHLVVYRS